jgi:hypothetical protein
MTPEQLHKWIEAAGGRRFLLTLGSSIVNTGLVIAKVISETTFAQLIMGTVAVFIAGASWKKDRSPPQ